MKSVLDRHMGHVEGVLNVGKAELDPNEATDLAAQREAIESKLRGQLKGGDGIEECFQSLIQHEHKDDKPR